MADEGKILLGAGLFGLAVWGIYEATHGPNVPLTPPPPGGATGKVTISISPSNAVVIIGSNTYVNNTAYNWPVGTYQWVAQAAGHTSKSGSLNLTKDGGAISATLVVSGGGGGGTWTPKFAVGDTIQYPEGTDMVINGVNVANKQYQLNDGIWRDGLYIDAVCVKVSGGVYLPRYVTGDIIAIGNDVYTIENVAMSPARYMVGAGRYPSDVFDNTWTDAQYIDSISTYIDHVVIDRS